MIHAILIEDNAGEIELFKKRAELPADISLHCITGIGEAEAYLLDPEKPVDLVFCDIRLDAGNESGNTGFDLMHRVEQQLGHIPFGIVFITGYQEKYALTIITMLVEQIAPTTLCGFVRKWDRKEPEMSFAQQIDQTLKTFRSKFTERISAFQMGDDPNHFGFQMRWFFNGRLNDYLDTTIRLAGEIKNQPQSISLQYRDIVAFQKSGPVIWVYFLKQDLLHRLQLDSYRLEEFDVRLSDLDFRPKNERDPEDADPDIRVNGGQVQLPAGRPVVFVRANGRWIINLAVPDWQRTTTRINPKGNMVNMAEGEVFLRCPAKLAEPLEDGQFYLTVATDRRCSWAKKYLKPMFRNID